VINDSNVEYDVVPIEITWRGETKEILSVVRSVRSGNIMSRGS
jgi:hypothetical protein